MSNDKPTATAVIRFFSNKRVEVEIDSLVGVSPRRLERANHLLMREYRGKRGAHNAKRHKMAREATAKNVVDTAKADAKFDKSEEKRLAEATTKALAAGKRKDKKAAKEAEKLAA